MFPEPKRFLPLLTAVFLFCGGISFSEDKDYHIKDVDEEAGYTPAGSMISQTTMPGQSGAKDRSGETEKDGSDALGGVTQETVGTYYKEGMQGKTKLTINGKEYTIVGNNVVDANGRVVGKVIGSGEQRGWKQPSDFLITVDGEKYKVAITKIERGPEKGTTGIVKKMPEIPSDAKPAGSFSVGGLDGEMHFMVGVKKYTARGNNILDAAGNVVGAIEQKGGARGPNTPEIIFNIEGKRYGVVMKQKAEKEKGIRDEGEKGTVFELPAKPRENMGPN